MYINHLSHTFVIVLAISLGIPSITSSIPYYTV